MATVVETDLLEDAALVVDECFAVEEGDVVTIICDDDREDEARAVAEVCVERGAWPVIMNNEAQVRRGRADVRFPMAPPANLHRAMVGSDEVIIIANLEWANRFAHVNAVRETCEANGKIAAIEDFTHGTAVVDGVMLGIGLEGQVKEPIRWTLEGGRCVKIEGGEEAERLRKAIDGVGNADVVGEFAFGTSEKAPFGTPSEKGRAGTVHLALGDNHNAYPGGQNVCSLHLDGVLLEATMWIEDDGTYILR